jgi:hypothetical protein
MTPIRPEDYLEPVPFSKKAQTVGYYFGDLRLRPNKEYHQFKIRMGDPSKGNRNFVQPDWPAHKLVVLRMIYKPFEGAD